MTLRSEMNEIRLLFSLLTCAQFCNHNLLYDTQFYTGLSNRLNSHSEKDDKLILKFIYYYIYLSWDRCYSILH